MQGKSDGHGGRRHRVLAAEVLATVALLLLAGAAVNSASAAQAPAFRETAQVEAHSTRALVETLFETFRLAGHWTASYSLHEKPEEFKEKWIEAGEGSVPVGTTTGFAFVGFPDATSFGERCNVLHHLSPKTRYFVLFLLTTEGGTTEKIVPFETHSIEAPEIPPRCLGFGGGAPILEPVGGTRTSETYTAQIETNGAPTEYHFEYAPSSSGPWQPFSSKGNGTISIAEDFADRETGLEAQLTGLSPETRYFVRLRVTHKSEIINGEPVEAAVVEVKSSFTTPTARPVADPTVVRNVRANSAHIAAQLEPGSSETHWRFESASSPLGPWSPIPGLQGVISQSEAEATPEGDSVFVEGQFTGLTSASQYCVRLYAENAAGEGLNRQNEPILSETREIECFTTAGPPSATTFPAHGLEEEHLRLLGSVNPGSTPTEEEQRIEVQGGATGGSFTLTFEGQQTSPIPYPASTAAVRKALEELPSAPHVAVFGATGGPYTIVFVGPQIEANESQITGDGSNLTPSKAIEATTLQDGGEGYHVEYHFQYVSQQDFETSGFANAAETTGEALQSERNLQFVGQTLPILQPGQRYDYRLVATSTFPGGSVETGSTQSLVVPTPVSPAPESCSNAARKVGASAPLPDCRAYEQVTPQDKEGAQEPFNYGPTAVSGAVVGEDGEHLVVHDPAVNWGTTPESGQSPYLFSRSEPLSTWLMTAGSPQPQTGVRRVTPELFNATASEVALEDDVHTAVGTGESKEIEYVVGPIGGPYESVAIVPRKQALGNAGFYEGWVAASADFSKLILQVEDHSLVSPSTKTKAGNDLYEYVDGELRQVNVGTGTCGAHMPTGEEMKGVRSSSHAVSVDGAEVFFEAAPSSNCSAPTDLYVRKDGSETINLGEYHFAGADAAGTKVLLEKRSGGATEYFMHDMEAGTTTPIFAGETKDPQEGASVAEDFSAIYFLTSEGDLYRYDVQSASLLYLFRIEGGGTAGRNGRFYYFQGTVAGMPAREQVFLYDATENVVQCVSCTRYDPEPKLPAVFPRHTVGDLGPLQGTDGYPNEIFMSDDGNFAFFDSPSELVSSDVDGEVAPDANAGAEDQSGEFSVSSDVYEWRRDGVDGCAQLEGCVALITNGRGGFLNLLVGTTPSGRDVFIYTLSQLIKQDNDQAGDIYDARVDGGSPPPPQPPIDCEGTTCSTPQSAPDDPTPASSVFSGVGNVTIAPAKPAAKPKPKSKHRRFKGKKKRRNKKRKRSHRAKHSSHSSHRGR